MGGRKEMKKIPFLFVAGVLGVTFFWTNAALTDERIVFSSGTVQNTLLELYTSDANPNGNLALEWMSVLKNEQGPQSLLWKRVIPVAMHVRLWDVPGYADSFSRPEYDDRLLAHKKKWGASKVYCPTMVANGIEWSGWSKQQSVPLEGVATGELYVDGTKREGLYQVEFKPSKTLSVKELTVHTALIGFGLKSKPSEGKNRGKLLKHDFICMGSRTKDLVFQSNGILTASVELARPKGLSVQQYAIIFWVTKKNDPTPLQAAGGYLPI